MSTQPNSRHQSPATLSLKFSESQARRLRRAFREAQQHPTLEDWMTRQLDDSASCTYELLRLRASELSRKHIRNRVTRRLLQKYECDESKLFRPHIQSTTGRGTPTKQCNFSDLPRTEEIRIQVTFDRMAMYESAASIFKIPATTWAHRALLKYCIPHH